MILPMWREASILLKAIRPHMTHWWLRRGVWWLGAILLCHLLGAVLQGTWVSQRNFSSGSGLDTTGAMLFILSVTAGSLGLWLACLLMGESIGAIETSTFNNPRTGWLKMRSLFLLLQAQLLPLAVLLAALDATKSALASIIMSRQSQLPGVLPGALQGWGGNLLQDAASTALTLIWLSALLAIEPGALRQARWIVGLHYAAAIVALLVMVPIMSLTGRSMDYSYFSMGSTAGLVSLAVLLLWLASLRLGWQQVYRAMSAFVALVPVLGTVLGAAALLNPQIGAWKALARLANMSIYMYGSLPLDGGQIGKWLLAHYPPGSNILSQLAPFADKLFGFLWLLLAYALVWGLLLRPDRAQRENQFTRPYSNDRAVTNLLP